MMAVFLHNLFKVLIVIGGVGAFLFGVVSLGIKAQARFGWKPTAAVGLTVYAVALAAGLTFL